MTLLPLLGLGCIDKLPAPLGTSLPSVAVTSEAVKERIIKILLSLSYKRTKLFVSKQDMIFLQ